MKTLSLCVGSVLLVSRVAALGDLPEYPGVLPATPLASLESLGGGTPGAPGVPTLTTGLPALGEAYPAVQLTGGLSGAPALLLYGTAATPQVLPGFGAVLHPGGSVGSLATTLDGTGAASGLGQPPGATPPSALGLPLVLQAAVADPAAAGGWAFSAGLSLTFGRGAPTAGLFPAAGAFVDQGLTNLTSLALGDLDGNGRRDAVTTRADGRVTVCLGDGAGRLVPAGVIASPLGAVHQVIVADRNADGRDDLLMVTEQGLTVRLGSDDPLLGPPLSQISPVPLGQAVSVRLDGDALPEVVATPGDNSKRLMRFPGQPGGSVGPGSLVGTALSYRQVAAGDMDGDNQDDLVLLASGEAEALGYFRVKQDGSLAPETFAALGGITAPKQLLVADLNSNGRDDAIVVGPSSETNAIVAVVVVPGSSIGLGPDVVAASYAGGVRTAALGRLDGDSDPDLVILGQAELRRLSGAPGLGFVVQESVPAWEPRAVATGRLDEGLTDDVLVRDLVGQLAVYRSLEGGLASGAEALPTIGEPWDLADLDGDGDLELLLRVSAGLAIVDAPGTPALSSATEIAIDSVLDARAADVTGDGLPDLVSFERPSLILPTAVVRVRPNLGAGSFGPPADIAGLTPGLRMVLGDLDGDGTDDVVVSGSQTVSVALADGSGGFVVPPSFNAGVTIASLALGDSTGDGLADLALADLFGPAVRLLPGLGDGTFLPGVDTPVSVAQAAGVSLADLDGDGLADLIVTDTEGASRIEVALGQPGGGFVVSDVLEAPSLWRAARAADVNGDGQPDLVAAGQAGPVVLLGQGTGRFGWAQPLLGTWGAVIAGDADEDGDTDLFVGRPPSPLGGDDGLLVLLRNGNP